MNFGAISMKCLAGFFLAATVAASAASLSNPTPVILSTGSTSVVRMDLTGFPAYGADGAADILYSGESGTWTFDLLALGVDLSAFTSARVRAWVALDDHYSSPASSYGIRFDQPAFGTSFASASVWGVEHGSPAQGPFSNWHSIITAPFGPPNQLAWSLTHVGGSPGPTDWLAIDAIEIILTPIPEPSSIALMVAGTAMAFALYRLLLEGTFSAKETGHMGLWSGSIRNITRCQVWR